MKIIYIKSFMVMISVAFAFYVGIVIMERIKAPSVYENHEAFLFLKKFLNVDEVDVCNVRGVSFAHSFWFSFKVEVDDIDNFMRVNSFQRFGDLEIPSVARGIFMANEISNKMYSCYRDDDGSYLYAIDDRGFFIYKY